MDRFGRTLLWPVVSLVLTGGLHLLIEASVPDLRTFFVPAVLAPILLGYGFWVGDRMVADGGSYVAGLVGAAILGLLPFALDVVGFGVVLGRGTDIGLQAGIFGWATIVFGGLLGAGVEQARRAAEASATVAARRPTAEVRSAS